MRLRVELDGGKAECLKGKDIVGGGLEHKAKEMGLLREEEWF